MRKLNLQTHSKKWNLQTLLEFLLMNKTKHLQTPSTLINIVKHLRLHKMIKKEPAFVTSSIYQPILPTKPTLSTQKDYLLIPVLIHSRFTFKALLTFFNASTDYTLKLHDKS